VTFAVSPRHTAEKLASGKLEDFVEVFEAQVIGWLIEPANHLRSSQHAGYAINPHDLALCHGAGLYA
jgi:hypothetical protein